MPVTSSIRIWLAADDYLTFDYAIAGAQYEPQGERLRDRDGNVHRISSGAERYPSWLDISLPASELTRLNNDHSPAPRSGLEWLEAAFRQQSPLTVFVAGETLTEDGSTLTRKLAYICKLDELSGAGLCSLPGSLSLSGRGSPASSALGSDPDWLELRLHVSEDGSFGDYDDLESYSAHDPPRSS